MPTKRIDRLYVFVREIPVDDDAGVKEERIMSVETDDGVLAMMITTEDNLPLMKGVAQKMCDRSGHTLKIVCFGKRTSAGEISRRLVSLH
jgi:hypothetical protein